MLTMIPVQRGTATSPRLFLRGKPDEIPDTLMNYRSPAPCAPVQQVGRRLVWHCRFNNAGKEKKKKKLKMPPTTLRAHIAMVTSSSTSPISSICLSQGFQSARRSHSTVPGNNLQPTVSSPSSRSLWFLRTYSICEIGVCNWLSISTGLRRGGKKKGEKRWNNELVKRQELREPLNRETGHFCCLFAPKIQGFSNGYGPLYVNPIHYLWLI